jgi:hypothetical protein
MGMQANPMGMRGSVPLSKSRQRTKVYNDSYSEYIKEKSALLLASSAGHQNILPFDDVWLADSWKRVTDETLMPIASVGAEKQVKKYGHFIYGSAGEHFYLAVPGRHVEGEWPDRGQSGFLLWQSIKKSKEYGYWCAVIDWKMGIIIEFP